MKICFVTIDYHSGQGGGGIGSYLYTLSMELVNTGHDVSIICGKTKGEPDFEEIKKVKVYRVSLGNIHYYLSKLPVVKQSITLPVREIEWSYAFWKKVLELNKSENFDIIESCETGNLFSILFPHKAPWIIRAHGATYSFKKYSGETIGLSERLDRAIQRHCMRRSAAVSAPSAFQAGEIEKEIGKKQSVAVIPNPVDPQFFEEENARRRKEDVGRRTKTILYTGRIEIRKGTLVLLKAMSHVIGQYENVELVIAGGRHVSVSEKMLDEVLDSRGIRSCVKLPGHIPWQEIKKLYESCDIFAIPSYYETFCISAVEAMACGRPVVGTFGTALPEVVEDGVTGLLVPPGDATALAEAILRLLNDEGLARRMGAAGREKAAQYRPDFIAKKTLEFYENVVGGKT